MTFNRLLPLPAARSMSSFHPDQCGSELAREYGFPFSINVADTPLSRASSLPHWHGVLNNKKGNRHGDVWRSTGQVTRGLRGRAGVRYSRVHTVELYRGLARSSINHVTPRHEQGAGFMADGYARTSGKPGVCFIITGPGMTNITTAMGQAYADSIPMLVISSVQTRSQLGGGRGKLHELPNQSALVGGVAAFSHTLMSAAELPAVLARAFALFQAGRPRPVHIEIPLDVLVEEADELLASVPVNIDRAGAAPAAVRRMSELLAGAQRPLILAGGGAIDAAAELTELAELLDAPVALTINAKGMLPASHPLLIGSTQSLVATRALVADADVVLAIGTELAETDYDVTFAGGFEIPGKLLRIDIDADQTVRNYPPHVALVADSRNAAQALLGALSQQALAERRNDWARCGQRVCAMSWPRPGMHPPWPRPVFWKPSCTSCRTRCSSATPRNRCTPATSPSTRSDHGAGSTRRPVTAPSVTPCRRRLARGSVATSRVALVRRWCA